MGCGTAEGCTLLEHVRGAPPPAWRHAAGYVALLYVTLLRFTGFAQTPNPSPSPRRDGHTLVGGKTTSTPRLADSNGVEELDHSSYEVQGQPCFLAVTKQDDANLLGS